MGDNILRLRNDLQKCVAVKFIVGKRSICLYLKLAPLYYVLFHNDKGDKLSPKRDSNYVDMK